MTRKLLTLFPFIFTIFFLWNGCGDSKSGGEKVSNNIEKKSEKLRSGELFSEDGWGPPAERSSSEGGSLEPTEMSEPPSEGVAEAGADSPEKSPDSKSPRPIRLPEDEAPHDVPIEWWYYTGTLEIEKTGKPVTYGFEMVTFQFKVRGSKFYVMQFAFTDTESKKFAHQTKFTFKEQPQPAKGFKLAIGSWSMGGTGGRDKLKADMKDYAIDLTLKAVKPVVFHYGKGYMFLAKNKPFYYYSYTRMAVSGTITAGGKSYPLKGGWAWMDHQWGESGRIGKDLDGWDWFSLRFDDQSEVMLFLLRGTKVGHVAGGTYIDQKGNTIELKKGDFTVTSKSTWKSPKSNAVYPQIWEIKIPSLKIDVTVTPVFPEQEVYSNPRDKSSIYWEGLCDISGKKGGKTASGRAYVELTGYAK